MSRHLLPLKVLLLIFSFLLKLAAAPVNDHFSSATVLTGLPVAVTGSNAGATLEASEPMPDEHLHRGSVWYRWTPAASGPVDINTGGSGRNTVLAVWAGDAIPSLTRLASNDDSYFPGAHDGESRIFLNVTAGTTYHIALYDSDAEDGVGDFKLNIKGDTLSSIGGRITGPGGTRPLVGIMVMAHSSNDEDGSWDWHTYTFTDDNGDYNVRGLDARTYRLEFYDPSSRYSGEFYENAAVVDYAADIVVGDSTTVGGIDASLLQTSAITGIVTSPDGVTPLPGVNVSAYQWDESWEDWSWYRSTTSGGDGRYHLPVREEGTYRIGFEDRSGDHMSEFHLDAPTVDSAASLVVTAGTSIIVGGIDASLAVASHITGRVTAEDGITPLEHVRVELYQKSEIPGKRIYHGSTFTAPNGTYDFGGLAGGTYMVLASDEDGRYYGTYFTYPGDEGYSEVLVGTGATVTGIDIPVAELAKITGTITASDGTTPLEGIEVICFEKQEWGWSSDGVFLTDSDGNYTIPGLKSGTYHLRFSDPDGNHVLEYYHDAATLEKARDIVVERSGTIGAINESLAPASYITGTVTASDGITPLEGVWVNAVRWDEESWWELLDSTETKADGTYRLGLAPGTYRLSFSPSLGEYVSGWYANARYFSSATDIVLGSSATVENIDMALAVESEISGRITGPDGMAPLEGIEVVVFKKMADSAGWNRVESIHTDETGRYFFGELTPGDYRLGFFDAGETYQYEYHRDSRTLTSAADIHMAEGDQALVDASLALTASITPQVVAMCPEDDGGFMLELYGGLGQSYQLQESTNLVDWQDVGLPVKWGWGSRFVPVAPSGSRQFWRFKSVP